MKILFFILGFFWVHRVSNPAIPKIVIWNVGQGSWTTWVDDSTCIHIDAGGSMSHFYPKTCRTKKNIFYYTHYDWDHINLSTQATFKFRSLCRMQIIPKNVSRFKRKKLEKIPLCSQENLPQVLSIYTSGFQIDNESHAFLLSKNFLITGDSPTKIEKKWLRSPLVAQTQFILAGHHGSRTSLSVDLLKQTPNTRMIFVSCLKKRYGHPHIETLRKAKQYKLPLIITENFGSVAIEVH
jgi:competence protein ComEC